MTHSNDGKSTVIVCGGAGYIGSHTAKQLARSGRRVVVVDDLSNGHEWAVQWGPLERGDIGDRAFMARVFAAYRPDAVLHFAALIDVADSVADPARYFDSNLVKSLRLFDAAAAAGIDKLVFSSTAAVYGSPDAGAPLAEDQPCAPINPYGESKLAAEQGLRNYPQYNAMRHVVLRYFNAAGADPDGQTGAAHKPITHLTPRAIMAALKSGGDDTPPLQLFGDDYPTPDGTCIRDYIHVQDLARAHVAALDYLDRGGASATFNLGTGRGSSVREILRTVEAVTGRSVPHTIAPRRAGDPASLIASNERARTILGWAPELGLSEIVATAAAWHGILQAKQA